MYSGGSTVLHDIETWQELKDYVDGFKKQRSNCMDTEIDMNCTKVKRVLPNNVILEGNLSEVNDICRKLEYSGPIYYSTSSNSNMSVYEMHTAHLKNAYAKAIREWGLYLSTLNSSKTSETPHPPTRWGSLYEDVIEELKHHYGGIAVKSLQTELKARGVLDD